MLSKKITPVIESLEGVKTVTGTKVEYRLFGMLLYLKRLYTPAHFGFKDEWTFYDRI
jgi:hypothetical protein